MVVPTNGYAQPNNARHTPNGVGALAAATARVSSLTASSRPSEVYKGGWTAPSPSNYARKNWRTSEKISGGPRNIVIPEFFPYYNDQTGETATMRIYYRRMLADPVVKAAVLGKIMAIMALEPQIHPADKNNPLDKEVAEFVQWVLCERLMGGFPHLVWNILIGRLVDGISVVEPIWRVEDDSDKWMGKWVVADQKAKDVDNDIVMEMDEFLNIVGIMGLRYNSGDYYDPKNFIISRHMPFLEAPGMSDFRAVYGRAWVLDAAWKLRAAGLERRSMPILFGTYATAAQKPSLEYALAHARYTNWISAPQGATVEVRDIAGRSQDEFRNAIQDLREEIFLGIQGALLQSLTGGEGTQRGSSKVHQSTSNLLKWALAKEICILLNNHDNGIIKTLVRLNYGKVDLPRATMDAIDDQELAQSIPVDSAFIQWGLPLSKSQMYEKYGRKPPENEEDALTGPQQQQPGGMPGMPPGMDMGGGAPPPGGEGLPSEAGEMPPEEMPGAEAPQAPEAAAPEAPQFTEPDMFTGPLKLFAEESVARWNSMPRGPRRSEVASTGKMLAHAGVVIYQADGKWRADSVAAFKPDKALRAG